VLKALIKLLCIFLPLFIISAPLYSQIRNSSKLYNQGVEAFKSGEIDKALELFKEAAQINNNYSLAHYGIGRVYLLQENKTADAVIHLKKAVELDSRFAKGYFYLGMAQLLTGKYNDSIASFKNAYERDASLQESLYNISRAYELSGDKVNSLTYYRRYISAKDKKDDEIF
jgi:tetratricopeptide (TPR) repeat protein